MDDNKTGRDLHMRKIGLLYGAYEIRLLLYLVSYDTLTGLFLFFFITYTLRCQSILIYARKYVKEAYDFLKISGLPTPNSAYLYSAPGQPLGHAPTKPGSYPGLVKLPSELV